MFRSLISAKDLTQEDVEKAIEIALKMEELLKDNAEIDLLSDKILATLFFEPSTRTRLSFEAAMHRLGGKVISVSDKGSTSSTKGETIYDSIRVVQNYADIIAMRHSDPEAPYAADSATMKPIINAGNGHDEHPSQALTDIFTMLKEKGRTDNLHVALVGDLKYGRTVHSLAYILSLFPKNHITFISPKALEMPKEYLEDLDKRSASYSATEDWDSALPHADVIYMTRVQQERFESKKEYEKYKDHYILSKEIIAEKCQNDVTIMHPLPRVNEIQTDIDDMPNAAYFRQTENSIPMRMAILALLLDKTAHL